MGGSWTKAGGTHLALISSRCYEGGMRSLIQALVPALLSVLAFAQDGVLSSLCFVESGGSATDLLVEGASIRAGAVGRIHAGLDLRLLEAAPGTKFAFVWCVDQAQPGSFPFTRRFFSNAPHLPALVLDPSSDKFPVVSLPFGEVTHDRGAWPAVSFGEWRVHLYLGGGAMTFSPSAAPTGYAQYYSFPLRVDLNQPNLMAPFSSDLYVGQEFEARLVVPSASSEPRVVYISPNGEEPVLEPMAFSAVILPGEVGCVVPVKAMRPGVGGLVVDLGESYGRVLSSNFTVSPTGPDGRLNPVPTHKLATLYGRKSCVSTRGQPGSGAMPLT
jgi:hypothetical protein